MVWSSQAPMEMLTRYALVFLVSLGLLLLGLTRAPSTFDEPAYVNAARAFNAATPSSNPEHPPLAKYFIAVSMKIFGGDAFGRRFPSALAGALLALSLFGLTFRMTGNLHTSYVAWLLLLGNGFWFVMSRVAMLPIFELAFEAAGVWVFVAAVQENNLRWLAWGGVLFGLSIGCRWSGVFGLAVCLGYLVIHCRPFIKRVAMMSGAAIAAYAGSWVPLMIREHRPASYLYTANVFIFQFQRHAKGDARVSQMWWSWLVRIQPQPSLSYLVGNPVIGVLGLMAIIVLLWRRKGLLPALYLANVLPWAIAVRPVTYYYYYLEGFCWLTVALAVALQGVAVRRVRLDVVATACAAAAFAYSFPA